MTAVYISHFVFVFVAMYNLYVLRKIASFNAKTHKTHKTHIARFYNIVIQNKKQRRKLKEWLIEYETTMTENSNYNNLFGFQKPAPVILGARPSNIPILKQPKQHETFDSDWFNLMPHIQYNQIIFVHVILILFFV